jgi:hypothetical protein
MQPFCVTRVSRPQRDTPANQHRVRRSGALSARAVNRELTPGHIRTLRVADPGEDVVVNLAGFLQVQEMARITDHNHV